MYIDKYFSNLASNSDTGTSHGFCYYLPNCDLIDCGLLNVRW